MSGSPTFPFDAPIAADEFEARLAEALAELDGPEGEAIIEHVRWFRRRYPTPLERLAYARRKYLEATATRGVARRTTRAT